MNEAVDLKDLLEKIDKLQKRVSDLEKHEIISRFPRLNVGFSGAVAGDGNLIVDGIEVIGDGAGAKYLDIDGEDGYNQQIRLLNNGSVRWILRTSDGVETGGNAGNDFEISARADDGSHITYPLKITRATGQFSVYNNLYAGSSIIHPKNDSKVLRYINDDTNDFFFTEIIRYNFTLSSGTSTITLPIDINDWAAQERGGYFIHGTLVGDDDSSNARGVAFSGLVRSTGSGTESQQAGNIDSDLSGGVISACKLRINTTTDELQMEFTTSLNLNQCMLWAIVTKQNL